MALGSDGPGGIAFDDAELARTVGIVCLVAILYEGGLSTSWRRMHHVAVPAALLGTVGVLVTALLTGVAAHALFDLDWPSSILLGGVVASTDAAAVFATLRHTHIRRRLARTLEGETGLNDPNWGLGATWVDYDNDGRFDLYLSNYVGGNKLFHNDGNWKFTDVTKVAGVDKHGWGKGPTFADVDHDGYIDLYEGDCKIGNTLYRNDHGTFKDITGLFPFMKNEGVRTKGTAFTDLDGDGDEDLYVVEWNVPNKVYRNNQNDKGFIKVRLTGTISNRMAIGSLARVYDGGFAENQKHFRGMRELRTATGFCSQEGQELHFGVPVGGTYDVVVNFPSGVKVIQRGVKAGTVLSIEEPNTVAKK